jgi:D-beta-D-heptose 7-phosphate kinase/D-beta-D-heptose 1-phosphate adenosyltransferase
VVISDYGKGVLTGRVLQSVVSWCRRLRKPIVADPKGLEYRRYRGIDILTPNLKETQAASGVAIEDDASLGRAAQELNRQVMGKRFA